MTQPISERILRAMAAAAQGIRTAAGYTTDVGEHVQVAESDLAETDLPGVILWPGTDQLAAQYGAGEKTLSVTVLAILAHGAEIPGYLVLRVLADLEEALCAPVLSLPFSAGTVEVSVGATVGGMLSGAGGYVGAVSVLSGSWAGGDAAGVLALRRLTGSGLFASGEILTVLGVPVATASGAGTYQAATERVTAGLAKGIQYDGGGADEYPTAGQKITGVTAVFTVRYRTRPGDSYHQ